MAAPEREYETLTVADLFAAREAYQVHLLALPHVLATAIGLYLAREGEVSTKTTFDARLALKPGMQKQRTLENSRPVNWSWPCVLVFVDHWMTAREIQKDPDAMVPRQLYLPDGRRVPTCVVFAPPAPGPPDRDQHLSFPSALLGGGYVCLADLQGQQRAASIACLVSDGDNVYALTNRHVAGERGRRLYTEVDGSPMEIGVSSGRAVGHLPLTTAYPGLRGERVELAVDAGLIELDDVTGATTQVFGIGRLGNVVDIGPHSLSLDWIGRPVRAFGGASGPLHGQVAALGYRYKTLAGVDYLADALIGPRSGTVLNTRPGDSGTLWVLDDDPPPADGDKGPRPLALQWGGHRFAGEHGASPYALATFLSTALHALDVDIVEDWNADQPAYWGVTGHYTIGGRSCDLVKPTALRKFFVANRTRIAFELDDIVSGEFLEGDGLFTPLADVPDRVWKHPPHGASTRRGRERPNHFADIDEPGPDGKTLLERYRDDPDSLTPQNWLAFYTTAASHPDALSQGLLPFRVAQLYREIVENLNAGNTLHALGAAGVMAHYVGDACQPLHGSRFSDGRATDAHKHVHSAYEDDMLDRHRKDVRDGLDEALKKITPPKPITGHRAAAAATVDLMLRTTERLPPETIFNAWNAPQANVQSLWLAVGDETIDCIADGCLTLAMLWSSAFKEAGAAAPPATALSKNDLAALYTDDSFAISLTLPLYAKSGLW